jgi:hypothetical protein
MLYKFCKILFVFTFPRRDFFGNAVHMFLSERVKSINSEMQNKNKCDILLVKYEASLPECSPPDLSQTGETFFPFS